MIFRVTLAAVRRIGMLSTEDLHVKISGAPRGERVTGRHSGARVTMHVGYPHSGHCPAPAMDGHARILAGNQAEGPHAVS